MLYFNNIRLNESVEFTIKNLLDLLTNFGSGEIEGIENKIATVTYEFNKLYKLDDNVRNQLLSTIYKFNINKKFEVEVIDFVKMDKFHHLKLNIEMMLGKNQIGKNTLARIYTIYFHATHSYEFPSYMSKYTMPVIVDGRFCVYITFDEKEIEAVQTLVSENMLDIMAPVYLTNLSVNKSIFKK